MLPRPNVPIQDLLMDLREDLRPIEGRKRRHCPRMPNVLEGECKP